MPAARLAGVETVGVHDMGLSVDIRTPRVGARLTMGLRLLPRTACEILPSALFDSRDSCVILIKEAES